MYHPFLLRMTQEEFAELPNKVIPRTIRVADPAYQSQDAIDWLFIGYCEKLLDKNQPLQEWLRQFAGHSPPLDGPLSWTRGQRVLHYSAIFDGQVRNGGLNQFFWNCPELIIGTHEVLIDLGESELSEDYDRAVESLLGNIEDWNLLREQSAKEPKRFWQPFQDSYDLLDLNWFDESYFKKYSPVLIHRLVDYVKTHKSEFIKS